MKKTIKIIFTGVVFLITNIALAQSKEETEQWLNEYGKQITLSFVKTDDYKSQSYLFNFTKFDGEFLHFSRIWTFSDGGGWRDTYKVSPKNIFYQDVSKFSEDNFGDTDTNLKIYLITSKSGSIFNTGKATNGKNSKGATNGYSYPNNKSEIEENI